MPWGARQQQREKRTVLVQAVTDEQTYLKVRDHGVHQFLTEWRICLKRATYGEEIQERAEGNKEKIPVREAQLQTSYKAAVSAKGQPHSQIQPDFLAGQGLLH